MAWRVSFNVGDGEFDGLDGLGEFTEIGWRRLGVLVGVAVCWFAGFVRRRLIVFRRPILGRRSGWVRRPRRSVLFEESGDALVAGVAGVAWRSSCRGCRCRVR